MGKRFLDLLVGLALGGLVGGSLVSVRWQEAMAQTYLLHTADQAVVAAGIARGEQDALSRRIFEALPSYVQTIESQFSGRPERCWTLWQVRKAYEAAARPVPAELQPILSGLPPESECPSPLPQGLQPGAPPPAGGES